MWLMVFNQSQRIIHMLLLNIKSQLFVVFFEHLNIYLLMCFFCKETAIYVHIFSTSFTATVSEHLHLPEERVIVGSDLLLFPRAGF